MVLGYFQQLRSESLDFLDQFNFKYIKIASGEVTDLPLLRAIGRKRVILSTGMCSLEDIESALNSLESEGLQRKDITILHYTTEYPAPIDEVNSKQLKRYENILALR